MDDVLSEQVSSYDSESNAINQLREIIAERFQAAENNLLRATGSHVDAERYNVAAARTALVSRGHKRKASRLE